MYSKETQFEANVNGEIGCDNRNDTFTCYAQFEVFANMEAYQMPGSLRQGFRMNWAKVYWDTKNCSGSGFFDTDRVHDAVVDNLESLLQSGIDLDLGFNDHGVVHPLSFIEKGGRNHACFEALRMPKHALGMQVQARKLDAEMGTQTVAVLPHILVWEHVGEETVLVFERTVSPGMSALSIPTR